MNPFDAPPGDHDTEPVASESYDPATLDLGELETRVIAGERATENAIQTITGDLIEVKQLLARLLEQEQAKKPRRWSTYATDDEKAALADWVDSLNTDYSLNRQYAIPPCWPRHRGVVEELAALWLSWKRSAIAAETTRRNGTNDYIAWHDRWLWPAMRRIKDGHYDVANCRERHTAARGSDRLTDRGGWESAAVAAPTTWRETGS